MTDGGLRLVSGGTDNHLCLVDLTASDITGKDAEKLLESVGLTVNKNSIPNEQRSPFVTSGIRVGSAAATTRGFTAEDFYEIGQLIATTVFNATDDAKLADVRRRVDALLESPPPRTRALGVLKSSRGCAGAGADGASARRLRSDWNSPVDCSTKRAIA